MVTARLNSFFFVIKPRETIVLVIVVPTLAPIIIGTAPGNVMDPEATRATVIAVVAELLCISAVTNRPIKSPVNGFEVASKIISAASLPKCCSEAIIRSRVNRKISNAARIKAVFLKIILQRLGAWESGISVGSSVTLHVNILMRP